MNKDIFLSYRNDGCSNQYARRLRDDLVELGYSVYFNPDEHRSGNFPNRLRMAVSSCKDFVVVLSTMSLERLKRNESVDWVREELLIARQCDKNIVPILVEGATMPSIPDELPEQLRFLPDIDAVVLSDDYKLSPFSIFLDALKSKRDGFYSYKDTFNKNQKFCINDVFARMKAKAQNGDVEAMYELSMMFYYGVTSKDGESICDFEQAFHWLKKVSESDDILRYDAFNIIARMYYNGTVPREPQSYEKALEYIELAANNNAYAKAQKAQHLRMGLGCNFDYEKILDFYKEGIEGGDDLMAVALANFYIKYNKYSEAMAVYDSMTNITPDVNYKIGLIYRDGLLYDPPQPDYMQAAYYLREAADQKHIMAALEYGTMCLLPTGKFRKDFKNAEKYLTIAADGGVAQAQYLLAFMYKSGHVTKNLSLALKYFEKAMAQGHTLSALELITIYQQPETKNYQRAYECALMAAEHGVAEGEFLLGNLLFLGRGCEPDTNKAYEMFSKAKKHGIQYASNMMRHIEEGS